MGKPPRDKQRSSNTQTQASMSTSASVSSEQSVGVGAANMEDRDRGDDGESTMARGGANGGAPATGVDDHITVSTGWGSVVNNDHMGLGVDPMGGFYRDLSGAGFSAELPEIDFSDWATLTEDHLPQENLPPQGARGTSLTSYGSSSSTVAATTSYPTPATPRPSETPRSSRRNSTTSTVHTANSGRTPIPIAPANAVATAAAATSLGPHDCSLEAYDILRSLCAGPSPSPDASSKPGSVPLDHVLRLNRVASERLGRLLTCQCARSPHLALLYASVILRILDWYQQAADCAPTPTASIWSGSTGSPSSSSTMALDSTSPTPHHHQGHGAGGGNVVPVKMAIGSFNVDDLRVQNALKLQLLSGELRRAGRLIDQLGGQYSGGLRLSDHRFPYGGIDNLYQSLDSWLRGEHSRVSNMMRSKLKEFNT